MGRGGAGRKSVFQNCKEFKSMHLFIIYLSIYAFIARGPWFTPAQLHLHHVAWARKKRVKLTVLPIEPLGHECLGSCRKLLLCGFTEMLKYIYCSNFCCLLPTPPTVSPSHCLSLCPAAWCLDPRTLQDLSARWVSIEFYFLPVMCFSFLSCVNFPVVALPVKTAIEVLLFG